MPYYAHIRQDENGETIYQTVAEHLTGTAALCREFAADFGAEADGDLMGLAHDLGKCTDAFQKRLLEGGPVVDHTTAGMLTCIRMKRPSAAACVAGHHGGLLDVGNLRTDRAGEATLSGRFKKGVEGHYLERCGESGVTLPTLPPETPERDPLKASFRTRMLYSCLVDADFLDTERFMDGERGRGGYDDLPTLLRRLKEYIAPWQEPKTVLNKLRCKILNSCLDTGSKPKGIYTLTVPTGGGKTVASLAFALRHAVAHGMRRVIYVVPYTSIIEQNAEVFREILGDGNVLEHHSGVQFELSDGASPEEVRRALAAENWDMPVIVTTAVQFFESIYEDLLSRGEIAAPGWAPAKISLALYINENGELTQIVPTMDEVSKGKKTVLQPQSKPLPAPVKRASNIASNFLWDNSSYLLGIDQKGKPERSRECFAAAAKLHHAVLDGIDSPNARAILAFFDTWEPDRAAEHPALIRQLDDVTAGGNLVFRVDGRKVEEDAAIREAWQRYRDGGESGVKMQCLVTGKEDEIAAVHPSVKGVRDAQSSGAALVSFNAPAFCSYGREQNYNAPVGKYAAFAYTAALNHLLADSDHVQHIGDTTVVCWAEGADDAYPGFFSAVIGGGTYGGLSDNDLRAALKRLANGLPCDDLGVDPNRPFYILGLAPNAARLSVRFFLRDSFGKLMENVNAHYARLEIAGAKYSILPLWALLNATVRDPKKQVPSPVVSGATVRAVFSGTPYPVSLMEAVLLRIRAERNVTWERAAILKAYLAKNYERGSDHSMFSEVTSVQLNEDCNYMPYLLGRLFRVMEEIQLASMGWSVNRSINQRRTAGKRPSCGRQSTARTQPP